MIYPEKYERHVFDKAIIILEERNRCLMCKLNKGSKNKY